MHEGRLTIDDDKVTGESSLYWLTNYFPVLISLFALLRLFTTRTPTNTCSRQPNLFHGYQRDISRKAASPYLRGRPSGADRVVHKVRGCFYALFLFHLYKEPTLYIPAIF